MKRKLLVSFALILTGLVSISCNNNKDNKKINYIKDLESFYDALYGGEEEIYIDDLTIDTSTQININYPVKIIGKPSKSKLENAHFVLNGINVPGESTPISFSNIIFDGLVKEEDYDFNVEKQSFETIFGENWVNKNCITNTVGYINLTLENCDVTRYAAYDGPAIRIYNVDPYRESEKIVTINNCNFYKNIAYVGTICVGHDKGDTTITNSNFYDNLVKQVGGPSIANGKATIDNVKVVNNRFYRFLYDSHPDDLLFIRNRYFPAAAQTGSMYIGGSSCSVTNCYIANNETYFGGGFGFITPETKPEGHKMFFKDIDIVNNKAERGGAIYGKVGQNNTVKFINCSLLNNRANRCPATYLTSLVPYDNTKLICGNIEFIFSTIANNTCTNIDTEYIDNQFTFQDVIIAKANGKYDMRGCFAIDESTYEERDYNYFANKETALADGVVTQENLDNILEKGLVPVKGSKADITVPVEVYREWDSSFESETEARQLGYYRVSEEITQPKSYKKLIIIVSSSVLFTAILVVTLVFVIRVVKKKKDKEIDSNIIKNDYDTILKAISKNLTQYNLTNKENEVAAYVVLDFKRKEIADKLFVSDDTIKTHVSHIFKKLNITSREELRRIVSKYL